MLPKHIFLYIILLFSIIFLLPPVVEATPPQDIQIFYDGIQQALQVTIIHHSNFPNYHYIKKVTILKNGKPFGEFTYKGQPDKNTVSHSYPAIVSPGDVFDVTAKCNLYGLKTVKFTVPQPK